MAIGPRRTWPAPPTAAAVISDPMVAPTYTPWPQLNAWKTSGMVSLRRPPKIIALIGTPWGSFASGASSGLLAIGAVKRLLGCAAFSRESGVHLFPFQSRHSRGGEPSLPSHQTSRSGVSATFVKMVSWEIISTAAGLDCELVPGTTPK